MQDIIKISAGELFGEDKLPIKKETFSCALSRCEENAPLISYEAVEIDLVVSGSGIHRVFGRDIPCSFGDIFISDTETPHTFFTSEDGGDLEVERIWFAPDVWLDGDFSDKTSSRYCYHIFADCIPLVHAVLNEKTKKRIDYLIEGIRTEKENRGTEWSEAARAYLAMLLITLGRYLGSEIKNRGESMIRPKDRGIVSLAVKEVMMGFSDPSMTLERIADTLYISKSTLSRLFRDATGKSFGDYLREVRVKSACALLCESSLTVEEIAGRCGLRDLATFYKTFSSITGMTPSVYRSHNKKQKELKNSNKGEKFMSILTEICENLQKGKAKIVKELCENAINEGLDPEIILNEGLLAGMSVIGEKFKNNEVYVPEVLVAARAMNMGTQVLKPHLLAKGATAKGKVCIGTVQGDLHDIGKNLVKMMMEGKGLEVVDLGTDVTPENFVNTAIEQNCDIICCSALLTTTMGVMADVVNLATEKGIRDKVKIMVGGAPVNEDFCKKIGADAYTSDAASAADLAVSFCK